MEVDGDNVNGGLPERFECFGGVVVGVGVDRDDVDDADVDDDGNL